SGRRGLEPPRAARRVVSTHAQLDVRRGGAIRALEQRGGREPARRGARGEERVRGVQLPLLAARSPLGHEITMRAPPSLAVSISARPPCSAATRATIASPNPYPPVPRLRLSSRRV